MADLADMRLVDLVGEDSILGALAKCQIRPTSMYHALDAYMIGFKPNLTILDVLADFCWERVQVAGKNCSRISPEFLADELRALGPV